MPDQNLLSHIYYFNHLDVYSKCKIYVSVHRFRHLLLKGLYVRHPMGCSLSKIVQLWLTVWGVDGVDLG